MHIYILRYFIEYKQNEVPNIYYYLIDTVRVLKKAHYNETHKSKILSMGSYLPM